MGHVGRHGGGNGGGCGVDHGNDTEHGDGHSGRTCYKEKEHGTSLLWQNGGMVYDCTTHM